MQVSSIGAQAAQYTKPLSTIALDDSGGSSDSSGSFQNVLSDAINATNQTDAADQLSTAGLLSGDTNSISDAAIATEKADIALRLTVQIRNRVIDAYDEVMRMQV